MCIIYHIIVLWLCCFVLVYKCGVAAVNMLVKDELWYIWLTEKEQVSLCYMWYELIWLMEIGRIRLMDSLFYMTYPVRIYRIYNRDITSSPPIYHSHFN